MKIWIFYAVTLLYMELVYHFGCFGLTGVSPFLPLALISIIASLQTLIVGLLKNKPQKIVFWAFPIAEYILFGVQTVYYTVFRQPLQFRAAVVGGQDALTNYWREALMGFLKALPLVLLMSLPMVVMLALLKRNRRRRAWKFRSFDGIERIRSGFALAVSVLLFYVILSVGHSVQAEFYDEYTEFYAPLSVAEKMGVLTMAQRDCFYEVEVLLTGKGLGGGLAAEEDELPELPVMPTKAPVITPVPTPEATLAPEATPAPTPTPTPAPHMFELDLNKLTESSAGAKQKEWLAQYISALTPTRENEYTGMFEGYNLIYLTAEGFSTYAIHPELTPTLYKLVNSGFVFTNYYVPIWQTITSDGEYVNCTGLIPDGQFSMRKSGANNMAYTLPKFFATEGITSYAYHNNTMSYYDRYITHPNLGYIFKTSKLGECPEAEYGQYLFQMENPGRWPSSDYEMMQGTVPEYINMDRFHVYYMTISGHMYYSFSGNSMSSRNKEAVQHLDMSENARAYYACHIELDKALQYLLEELEAAGKLENTVICMSADHYPYGMTEEEYEELAGKDLSENLDTYRNSLILWNAGIKEPIVVDKACCSIDILPTLLNLFGFEYDSRMYAGRDIFSDEEGVVIFNDRSFVTDTVYYDRKKKTTVFKKEMTVEEQEAYMEAMKAEVKRRYSFSAYILQENYYQLIEECRIKP